MNQLESDYRPTVLPGIAGRFLPGTSIEFLREFQSPEPPEHVLFDFDGTLSLIREGWPEIMIPMMVEILAATGTAETSAELHRLATAFVMELNGKQTIYQMIRLAGEVAARGGTPQAPLEYKRLYHERLMHHIASRREALRCGAAAPESMLVPGSLDILRNLRGRGVRLHLASGTDEPYVKEEAELLGLVEFFGSAIHGAVDDYKTFSKAQVIARILETNRVAGRRLLGFGDGYVEIQNIKEKDGFAIAVASDEAGRSGQPDVWKRERLVGVGADAVIPDFREQETLVNHLWNRN